MQLFSDVNLSQSRRFDLLDWTLAIILNILDYYKEVSKEQPFLNTEYNCRNKVQGALALLEYIPHQNRQTTDADRDMTSTSHTQFVIFWHVRVFIQLIGYGPSLFDVFN